jgi:hypothetical protein
MENPLTAELPRAKTGHLRSSADARTEMLTKIGTLLEQTIGD